MKIKNAINDYYKSEIDKIEIDYYPEAYLGGDQEKKTSENSQNIIFGFGLTAVLVLFLLIGSIYGSPFASDIAAYSKENKFDELYDSKIMDFISYIDESKIFNK